MISYDERSSTYVFFFTLKMHKKTDLALKRFLFSGFGMVLWGFFLGYGWDLSRFL
jgi:hypothetical protein